MKQRTAILVAIALTAFVVVLVAATALSITWKGAASQAAASEAIVVEGMNGATGQQSNAPVAPTTNSPATTATAPSTAQPQAISADSATRAALALFPGDNLAQPPELVNYKGKMAYEVVLGGAVVYVDAFTGQMVTSVLTAASNPTSSENAASSFSSSMQYDDAEGEHDESAEHDSDENDDEHDGNHDDNEDHD